MPSSTSSSDHLDPGANGLRPWWLALLIFALAGCGWEFYWRTQSVEPSFDMSAEIWLQQRQSITPNTIALVGTSRIRSGIDPLLLSSLLNEPVAQLGLNGASGLPVLENLAEDPAYRGTVILEVVPATFFDATRGGEAVAEAAIEGFSKGRSPFAIAETRLNREMHATFVSRHASLSLVPVLASLRRLKSPRTPFYRIEESGFLRQDFRGEKIIRWDREEMVLPEAHAFGPEGVKELVARTERAVQRIRERGGSVILMRFPSALMHLAQARQKFPRERYWDMLARGTTAVSIHYEDWEPISGMQPPDGSHLDFRDAERMTRFVATAIDDARKSDD